MIVENYDNPNKPVPKWLGWQAPAQTGTRPPQHTQMEDYWAKRKGLTVEEYLRRDKIVRDEYAKCKYFKDAIVWPYSHKLCETKGQYRIVGLLKAYHEFDTAEWNVKNDNAYIVMASPLTDPNQTLFTTVEYFQQDKPQPESEEA